jgi:hypothetical protein
MNYADFIKVHDSTPPTDDERSRYQKYVDKMYSPDDPQSFYSGIASANQSDARSSEKRFDQWLVQDRAIRLGATSDRALDALVDQGHIEEWQRSVVEVAANPEGEPSESRKYVEDYEFANAEPFETTGQQKLKDELEKPSEIDTLINQRIKDIQGVDYQEDPALDAALAAAEGVRTNQIKAIEDLSEITLGRKTLADMRGDVQSADIRSAASGGLGGGFRGYAGAMRQNAAESTGASLAERAGQREALGQAASRFMRQETADLGMSDAREMARLGHDQRKRELIGEYLGMASRKNIGDIGRTVSQYGLESDRTAGQMSMPQASNYDYTMPAIVGGLSAGSAIASTVARNMQPSGPSQIQRSVSSMLSDIQSPSLKREQGGPSMISDYLKGRTW